MTEAKKTDLTEDLGLDNQCFSDGCQAVLPETQSMCDECYDRIRERDREADYDDYVSYLTEVLG